MEHIVLASLRLSHHLLQMIHLVTKSLSLELKGALILNDSLHLGILLFLFPLSFAFSPCPLDEEISPAFLRYFVRENLC